jgi:2-methylisocitrate lyase-like PEP mutase family enzyme
MAVLQESTRTLRGLVERPQGVVAPLVLNPLMARLAEAAGFEAAYLGGGAMGYVHGGTEANLTLTQMTHAGAEIMAQSDLPLILDGACGWGDPMHVRHSVRVAEAAGFAAVEIEDQLLPKRAHHHIGIEHLIPFDLMIAKVEAAVAARRTRDFLIIARTNAARKATRDLNEAIRRGQAFHRAGADLLLVMAESAPDLRLLAPKLPKPLMCMLPGGGVAALGMSFSELAALGYSLIVDSQTPLLATVHTLQKTYAAIAAGRPDPLIGTSGPDEEAVIHRAINLEAMLEIERRTVERRS